MNEIFLSINSHRASDKLKRLLNRPLDWHYTFEKGGIFVPVSKDEYDRIKAAKIKSITKPRMQTGYSRCWY